MPDSRSLRSLYGLYEHPEAVPPTVALGSAAGSGILGTTIRSDATLLAFDGVAPGTEVFGQAAGVGAATVAARRDHAHGFPAAGSVMAVALADTWANGSAATISRSDHNHGMPTTKLITMAASGASSGTSLTVSSLSGTKDWLIYFAMGHIGTSVDFTMTLGGVGSGYYGAAVRTIDGVSSIVDDNNNANMRLYKSSASANNGNCGGHILIQQAGVSGAGTGVITSITSVLGGFRAVSCYAGATGSYGFTTFTLTWTDSVSYNYGLYYINR